MSHNIFPIPKGYLEPAARACLRKIHPLLKAFAKEWDERSGALLCGPTDCGKSLIVAALCDRLSRKKGSETHVRWIRAGELARLLSDKGGFDDVRMLKACPLLVIDEMGWESWPETIQEVIGDRWEWRKPVLVTTGQPFGAFADRYSDAVVRKITTIGCGALVDCWEAA